MGRLDLDELLAAGTPVYRFVWRNRFDGRRKDHLCVVLGRTVLNNALVAWLEGGRDVVSRNALRRWHGPAGAPIRAASAAREV
jgi:hypothetical protein